MKPLSERSERSEPYPYVVGIDGGKSTGVAVWGVELQRFVSVETSSFWPAYSVICDCMKPDEALIVIEYPSAIRPTFGRKSKRGGRVGKAIAQSVGRVKRETELLAEGLELAGYRVERVTPKGAKWADEQFRRIAGWEKRTSQHGRDAARLVFGHSGTLPRKVR